MRSFRKMARFSKGLRVDESGLPGALLEANNVRPLRNGAGYQTRGSKVRRSLNTGSLLHGGVAWPVSLPLFRGAMFFTSDVASMPLFVPQFVAFAGQQVTSLLPNSPRNAINAFRTPPQWYNVAHYGSNGSAAQLRDEMFFAVIRDERAGGVPVKWAGLSTTTGYRTGTISGTAGSTTITGVGTTFVDNVRVGDYVWPDDGGLSPAWGERYLRVERVVSNTQLIVDAPVAASFATQSYRVDALVPWTVKPGTFGHEGAGTTAITRNSLAMVRSIVQHKGRLFGLGTVELDNQFYGDRLRWCAAPREVSNGWRGGDYWHPAAYSDVAPGIGGQGRGALASVGSTLFVIKENAVFAFRGDVETDGRDVGASTSLFSDQDGIFGGADPVQVPGGALFCGRKGLWLLTESGMRNVTDEAGLSSLWAEMFPNRTWLEEENEVGSIQALSVLDDRVIVHGGKTLTYGDGSPNTLVWHTKENLWTTQTTYATTRAIPVNPSLTGIPIAGVYGDLALTRPLEAQGAFGALVDWRDDYTDNVDVERDGIVRMQLTTHPISIAEQGSINGRLRAIQVKGVVEDTALDATVLLGEEGTNDSVEAVIDGGVAVETLVDDMTEQWYRSPVRNGTPPVDQVRLRLVQGSPSPRCIVYEAGVEVLGVGRIRQ